MCPEHTGPYIQSCAADKNMLQNLIVLFKKYKYPGFRLIIADNDSFHFFSKFVDATVCKLYNSLLRKGGKLCLEGGRHMDGSPVDTVKEVEEILSYHVENGTFMTNGACVNDENLHLVDGVIVHNPNILATSFSSVCHIENVNSTIQPYPLPDEHFACSNDNIDYYMGIKN